ncbi:4'-phosphopantetheinyl transferase family protein [Entomomonas asaccharolytica]|uniref:Enterobactin synthase component D n=1 Tax=Entomomonas asaccharolytica TaxID=2785331 RepID=A0A974RXW3_9GAMM|nr:4'-phosphopantetheinyl transferase superfamily protein [Entomomonas asaccharolytica]QQP86676.1 4'-phosphopantetheinyl transferase superfamily protein [Entomomonas asaccharolytica]
MNLLNIPTFYSSFSKQWVFPSGLENVCLCHCQFNQQHFTDTAFKQHNIEQPAVLVSAAKKRNTEYLIGRLCAREALKNLNITGYPLTNADKSPQWPSLSCGSITHSHHTAAAIVALKTHWQSLGLDIEYLISEQRSKKLLATIVNQNEQKLIDNDISLFTTLAFSMKESLYKALYPITLKRFYFKHAEIIDWNTRGEVTLKLLIDLSDKWQKGTLITGQYCVKDNFVWSLIAVDNKRY